MKLEKIFLILFMITTSFYSKADTFITHGNNVSTLLTGKELNAKRLELIEHAQHFIYLKTFIINRDLTEALVYEALCDKAKSGIDVRMLVDDIGRREGGNPIKMKNGVFSIEWFKSCGIRFERYAKISWGLIDFILYNQHDKILVSENEGIVGGTNFSRDYSSHGQLSKRWYDFDISIMGPAVCSLQKIFRSSWWNAFHQEFEGLNSLSSKRRHEKISERFSPETLDENCHHPEEVGNKAISLLYNNPLFKSERPFQDYIIDSLESMVKENKDKIVNLNSPYFIPSKILIDKLIMAAEAGVRVRVITNSDTSIDQEAFVSYVAMLTRVQPLLDHGIEVYLWNPSKKPESGLDKDNVFHKKGGCFGSLSCFVGSHNLDTRGDNFSSELMAVLTDLELIAARRASFNDDLRYSVPLTTASRKALLKHSKITQKLLAHIASWAM